MDSSEFFVYYIFSPAIMVLGLFGNIMALILFRNNRLNKIGPLIMYRLLFSMDTVYLITIIRYYLSVTYDLDLTSVSRIYCKLYYYISYSLATISPMMLVFISVERIISVKYPSKKFLFHCKKYQLIYFVSVLALNLALYTEVLFYYEIFNTTRTSLVNNTIVREVMYYCDFINKPSLITMGIIDLINRLLIPFILMTICSFFLTQSIIRMRRRILENFLPNQNKNDIKGIRLGLTSISFNIFYIVLNLPISILYLFTKTSVYEAYTGLNILYMSYSINFYLLFISNSLFRTEFFNLFKFCVKSRRNQIKK